MSCGQRSALLIVIFLILGQSAFAQSVRPSEAIPPSNLRQFYQTCLSKSHHGISSDAKRLFCSCTAKHLKNNVTTSDLRRYYGRPNQQNVKTPLKIIHMVFAPCVEYAAGDYAFQSCLRNAFQSKQPGLCVCMGARMTRYISKNAASILVQHVSHTARVKDPVKVLLDDRMVQLETKKSALDCLQTMQKP